MKRLLQGIIILAALLALPVFSANAQGDGPTLTATVIFDAVFLREGPGLEYASVGEAVRDDTLTLVGRSEDGAWFQTQLADESLAWVANYLVSVDGDPGNLPVAGALPDAVIVPPGCDYFNIGPFFATSEQSIILVQGWEAATRDLVEQYVDDVIQVVSFDGRLISTYAAYRQEITANDARGTWQVFWVFDMGPVAAGEHRIEWTQMFNGAITDGLDADGDGQPDSYGPEAMTYGCTLIVE